VPEPIDAIRRVNAGEPMTLDELYQTWLVLDKHATRGKADVVGARWRVAKLIDERTASGERPIAAPPAAYVGGGDSKAGDLQAAGVSNAKKLNLSQRLCALAGHMTRMGGPPPRTAVVLGGEAKLICNRCGQQID